MRTLVTIITILTITITTTFAGVNPTVVLSTPTVEIVSVETLDFFTTAEFNNESENLVFTTSKEIATILILSAEGDMEFQLPVMSDNVQINKSLFGQGNFKLGFMLQGESEMHLTQVTIK